jgi:L-amino acid N-acyltransferase YncA
MTRLVDNFSPLVSSYRLAARSDLDAIVAIYNATVASRLVTADLAPVSIESRRQWFGDHDPDRRPLWVVERGDAVAAWLSFSNFSGRPAYGPTAEISVYVHADHRGNGLGRYLVQQAIGHAPALRVNTLLGFIFGHNEPSLRLFRKYGFEEWGRLPRVAQLDGIERDLVIVGRRVDA